MNLIDFDNSSDDRLEAAFSSGDDELLRAAYERFGGLIFTLCCRRLPRHLAEEATQQVFVSAWQNRHRFDPSVGSLAAWLTGIAKNRIIDVFRGEQRATQGANHAINDNLSQPSDDTAQFIEQLLVSDAIAQLTSRPAKVVTMSLYEELTHSEIAERLGLPIGTVKSDIRRGLEHLRRSLRGAEYA